MRSAENLREDWEAVTEEEEEGEEEVETRVHPRDERPMTVAHEIFSS